LNGNLTKRSVAKVQSDRDAEFMSPWSMLVK
jgi:hypothetical protein